MCPHLQTDVFLCLNYKYFCCNSNIKGKLKDTKMNYQKIYDSLIEKRRNHPAKLEFNYTENHHIIPRSIDKSLEKEKSNIVSLSAKEHFIAHALLVKIYKQSRR